MSLLLSEKLAISSIFPLQKGGSLSPSNSKYLLSNSIGVLGVSASFSAMIETSRQRRTRKHAQPHEPFHKYTIQIGFGSLLWSDCLFETPLSVTVGCWALMVHGRRRRWPTANQAAEKWCNARARLPASVPNSQGARTAERAHSNRHRLL